LRIAEADDDDDDGVAANEVLDSNVWERRCRALEQRAASEPASASSSCSSLGAESASTASSSSGSLAVAAAFEAAASGSTGIESLSAEPTPTLPGPRCPLDDDSDEDAAPGLGPLAAEGPAPELPSAPTDRAKPKACDLELDMFGEPEEDTMEVVD